MIRLRGLNEILGIIAGHAREAVANQRSGDGSAIGACLGRVEGCIAAEDVGAEIVNTYASTLSSQQKTDLQALPEELRPLIKLALAASHAQLSILRSDSALEACTVVQARRGYPEGIEIYLSKSGELTVTGYLDEIGP